MQTKYILRAIMGVTLLSAFGVASSFASASPAYRYAFSISDILEMNKNEISSTAALKKVDFHAEVATDTSTRIKNWSKFEKKYEGSGIYKLFRKLKKDEMAAAKALLAQRKANLVLAEDEFDSAQKNRDIPAMSGALAKIIKANTDGYASVGFYVAAGKLETFNSLIKDYNDTQTSNKLMRITDTQKLIGLKQENEQAKKVLGSKTEAYLDKELRAVPKAAYGRIRQKLFKEIDALVSEQQASKSKSKDSTIEQLEAIRQAIRGYKR